VVTFSIAASGSEISARPRLDLVVALPDRAAEGLDLVRERLEFPSEFPCAVLVPRFAGRLVLVFGLPILRDGFGQPGLLFAGFLELLLVTLPSVCPATSTY